MSRSRLAPDLAWPVTRARLTELLGDEHDGLRFYFHDQIKRPVTEPIDVGWTTQESTDAVGYDFWTAGLKVSVRPVAKTELDAIRSLMETEVLPDLARWVDEALTAGEAWQLTAHRRRWTLQGGGIVTTDESGARRTR